MRHFAWFFIVLITSCSLKNKDLRDYIRLDGTWQFALDTLNIGISNKWYLSGFNDSILLPGTTDLRQKGFKNTDTTTMHLNRMYTYEGAAWYRKKIYIPETFKNKHIQLYLERTKSTKIWIDSMYAGSSHILQSPQQFDVSEYLKPGEHYITIQINNSLKLTPFGNVHIYSDDTQTNWNGIIGKICLEVTPLTYISNIQVYSDIEKKSIAVTLQIENRLKLENIDVELLVEKITDGKSRHLKSKKVHTKCLNEIIIEYFLGNNMNLWDEYRRNVYQLTAVISGGSIKDSKTVPFGMREFSVDGKHFTINGRTIFLRGKHEAAVFPATGFTPTTIDEWKKIYKIAKSYGINHYRFHSYCPPEAAFKAADDEGIYIQAELPFWGGLDVDSIANMLKDEGIAMLNTYANHPSFVMFSPGNEIWSGHDRVEKNIVAFKKFDNRVLYTMGSNNNIGYVSPRGCSDFFIGARTPYSHDTIITHTRLTHAFADSKDGGILNTQTPSTDFNFDNATAQLKIPVVSHETGQYQIYPDYDEILKYNGVLHPWNLEIFHKRLYNAGLADMDKPFQKASGAWSAICYKAEMEAALRTKDLAGFQLLDLQDFPGQGTALVGILDAFMESKNVITPGEWKNSCNDVVLLLEFPKYCWLNNESFYAKIALANYSDKTFDNKLIWELYNETGSIIRYGSVENLRINKTGLFHIGEISANLSTVKKPEKLTIKVSLAGTDYKNAYPVWVYPVSNAIRNTKNLVITEKLSGTVLSQLNKGASVLFFPQTHDVQKNSIPGLFPPDFWNFGMFKGISEWVKKPVSPGTLGILTNPKHPLFTDFPTDFHTNWQWFSIIKASNSLILDNTSKEYRPIVQVIDNLERNHKLGLIFEFKVGQGKLLVCMAQLNKLLNKPEAFQLYQSIVNYMNSGNFNPEYNIQTKMLTNLFQ